jgi:molybdopterin-guanine dinucleotide biosynthesis protein
MCSAGMAGSGKTTLMQRINAHLHERGTASYLINLDPAVLDTPYEPNIDVRDTVRARARALWQAGCSAGTAAAVADVATPRGVRR